MHSKIHLQLAVVLAGLLSMHCGPTPPTTSTGGAGGSGGSGTGGTGGSAPPGINDPIIPTPSSACPQFTSGTQTIMGLSTVILAGAPGPTKGPLLITWHGTGSNGQQSLAQVPTSVQNDIVQRGGIIVAPTDNGQVRSGTDVTYVLGVWYDGADLDYADLVVGCAVRNHNIDPRRIYTTGCSAGGLMAGTMALERSSYVAAAAPNSGGIVIAKPLQDPARVPACMTMHGGSSDVVIVSFTDTSMNLQNALAGTGAFRVDCNTDGGHCGASVQLLERSWDFMKAHPFGTRPSPYEGGLPTNFPSYCTILR